MNDKIQSLAEPIAKLPLRSVEEYCQKSGQIIKIQQVEKIKLEYTEEQGKLIFKEQFLIPVTNIVTRWGERNINPFS